MFSIKKLVSFFMSLIIVGLFASEAISQPSADAGGIKSMKRDSIGEINLVK